MLTLSTDHKYAWNGQHVPGFSEICADLGVTEKNPFYTEAGREEGTLLHEWLLFLAQGQEPADPPDPRIAGRVEGIKKFLVESRFKFEQGEEKVYHPILRYACTPDLVGQMAGSRCIVETKRGARLKSHQLQTAAQKLAIEANGIYCRDRYALYLKDGDYRLEKHEDKLDMERWKTLPPAWHTMNWYRGK